MAVSITYNSQALANQIGRLSFQRTKTQATLSVEFAPDASNVETVIAALQKWDKDLVISTTGWSQTFKLNDTSSAVAFVSCRTAVDKTGSVLDSSGRKRLRFTAILELQDVDDDGFMDWAASCEEDVQGRKTVTVTGLVTAKNSANAKTQFEADIATIEGAFLTLYGGTYEQPYTVHDGMDRYKGRFQFARVHTQLLETVNQYSDTGSGDVENLDTDIRFVSWGIRRTTVMERGNDDAHVSFYSIRWGAVLAAGKTGIISQYDAGIRALVIKRLRDQFGDTGKLVLRNDDVDYSSTDQSCSANWIARVVGGTTVSYSETIRMPLKLADYDKVMSGGDFDIEPYSPGMMGEIIQTVEHVSQDVVPPIPPAPLIGGLAIGAKLVLLELDPEWGSVNLGRDDGGDGTNSVATAIDYSLKCIARYAIRKPPGFTPIESVPQGARGKPSKAVY
jgi:hypothetical protein